MAVADLDDDGRPDIAISGGLFRSELTILLNGFEIDATPPLLECPASMTVPCSSPEGAAVSFMASVTEDCDASPSLICDPPSGSTFAIGMTRVACTVTDASGNRSECAFEVTVTCGGQTPGDCNQDGAVDISDGICILEYLFSGRPVALPCTEGAGIGLLDWNGDELLDLSDAVSSLHWLFLSEPGHILGAECRFFEDCPAVCPLEP